MCMWLEDMFLDSVVLDKFCFICQTHRLAINICYLFNTFQISPLLILMVTSFNSIFFTCIFATFSYMILSLHPILKTLRCL